MKTPFAIACLALALSIAGCSSTNTARKTHLFLFEHEGEEYQIISVVESSSAGHNYLTLREDGQLVLSAKDEDQDGILDSMVKGDMSLIAANDIYSVGIGLARDRGKYRELPGSRTFEIWQQGHTSTIRTTTTDSGSLSNTFVYFGVTGREIVALDDNADGTLDRIVRGAANLEDSQKQYALALKEGVRLGRIRQSQGQFVVETIL